MKILILKPSSLGDVVHALPVLRLLKRGLPESQIFWWIDADLAPLLRGDADLSGLFTFEKGWNESGWAGHLWSSVRAMRWENFDIALDLQGLGRSAICGWFAGAGTFIGLDNPCEGQREAAQIFYDILAPASPAGTLATDRYLNILKMFNLPVHWDFEWLPVHEEVAAGVRAEARKHPGRWVMLMPGARWDNKRWPVESYAETVRQLAAQSADLHFAILGSAANRSLAEVITRAAPAQCLDLTGRTSLLEMVEWLRLADVVISNDTGPLHIAAALKRPLVPIYGPTDPHRTGPYGQVERVLQDRHLECVPCLKDRCHYRDPLACMKAITPEHVCARAMALLGN